MRTEICQDKLLPLDCLMYDTNLPYYFMHTVNQCFKKKKWTQSRAVGTKGPLGESIIYVCIYVCVYCGGSPGCF